MTGVKNFKIKPIQTSVVDFSLLCRVKALYSSKRVEADVLKKSNTCFEILKCVDKQVLKRSWTALR